MNDSRRDPSHSPSPPDERLPYRAGTTDAQAAVEARHTVARSVLFSIACVILVIAILLAIGGVVKTLFFSPADEPVPTSRPGGTGDAEARAARFADRRTPS